MASIADQFRQDLGISKYFAKGNSKGAVHVYLGKVIGVSRHVWYLITSAVQRCCRLVPIFGQRLVRRLWLRFLLLDDWFSPELEGWDGVEVNISFLPQGASASE